MSQRDSGYERKERDCYETPEWVTRALIPHLRGEDIATVWEPACGSGKMVRELERSFKVIATDIDDGTDFLDWTTTTVCDAIITNPPYNQADLFIHRALNLMQPKGVVAMLLRTDFDHAIGRGKLFANCSAFAKKLVLRKRIRWIEGSTGSPSFNHAWFIWDWRNKNSPTLAYD